MVARSFFQQYSLTASNSIVLPKQVNTPGAVYTETASGTYQILYIGKCSNALCVPFKITMGLSPSCAIYPTSNPSVQNEQIRAALRVVNTVDRDCIMTIDNATRYGKLRIDAKRKKLNQTITDRACVKIQSRNYVPDTMLVNPKQKNYISSLSNFNLVTVNSPPAINPFGALNQLALYSSINVPVNKAYVFSSGMTSSSNTNSPFGFFIERRPFTVGFPTNGGYGAITMRYAIAVTNGYSIMAIANLHP